MSQRLGTPGSQVVASVAPTAAGAVMTFGNAVVLASIAAVWVASATIGNRTVQVQVKDASGNILLRLPSVANIVASSTVNLEAGAGLTIQNFAGPPIVQTMPLPVDMPIVAGGSITVVDTANIDGAGDRVTIAAALSY
jgi:hypothetical protein